MNYLIAGPCAAETHEQVMQTAAALKGYADIFRAGIWKPRTSPDTFQGIGDEGLKWLQEVKATTGIDVATEVSTSEQVHQALAAGIDYLWIGARSSANPILVQHLADAIATSTRSPKGVWVKNPVNEDAELWAGNIHRLQEAQTSSRPFAIWAIHRGCNHHPCWRMAHRLRTLCPDIPLVMDPSHMSGKSDHIASLCCAAQTLGYEGLMTEVHICPAEAWSDAQQQITPQAWRDILSQLPGLAQPDDRELLWLRKEIDEVDERLWDALADRMEVCRQIGQHKREKHLPVVQPDRYQFILERRLEWAKQQGLDPQTIGEIMHLIHNESIRVQS